MRETGRRTEPTSVQELAGQATGLAEQRRAYYDVLQDDPNFVRALGTLFKTIFPAVSKSRTAKQSLDAIRGNDAPAETPELDARVNAFMRRWSLPQAHAFEVWCALYAAQYGQPLRLRAVQGHMAASFGAPAIRARIEPFIYDPSLDPHAEAKRVTTELREQLRQQMELQRQRFLKHGWRPVPPRRRDRAQNKIMALRLYRYAVLRWRWQQIAAAEGPGIQPRAVEVSVRAWAKQLGVPLRSAPRGRPKTKK
jgi:hypothetical protein